LRAGQCAPHGSADEGIELHVELCSAFWAFCIFFLNSGPRCSASPTASTSITTR
jgi:hypothetical protein